MDRGAGSAEGHDAARSHEPTSCGAVTPARVADLFCGDLPRSLTGEPPRNLLVETTTKARPWLWLKALQHPWLGIPSLTDKLSSPRQGADSSVTQGAAGILIAHVVPVDCAFSSRLTRCLMAVRLHDAGWRIGP